MMAEEPFQKADIKYSVELLEGFEVLAHKTDTGIQVCKDISEFYKKRAGIEEKYAKDLQNLYKSLPGASFLTKEPAITKETKTLKEALLSVQEKGNKLTEAHLELSTKIQNDICKVLDLWIKAKDPERKKIIADGAKNLKTLHELKANVPKAKDAYERIMRDADVAKEQLMKCEKDQVNQPDNKRLDPLTRKASQKHIDLVEKAKSLDAAYQGAVKKVNEELNACRKEKMPDILEQFQKWDEDHWNTLISAVRSYKSIEEDLPTAIQTQCEEIYEVVEAASIEDDFKEFIAAHKQATENEAEIVYTPFKSRFAEEQPKTKEVKVEPTFSTKTAEEHLEEDDTKEQKKSQEAEKKQQQKKEQEKKEQEKKQAAKDLFPEDEEEFVDEN